MTYKHIEASRNIRLWLVQVVVPVATLTATTLIALPDTRRSISNKAVQIKNTIKNKFKKKSDKSDNRTIISIHAKDRAEALGALEILAKEIINGPKDSIWIKKSVQTNDSRKA